VVALSSLQFDRLNLHFFTVILYSVMTVVVPYCTGKVSLTLYFMNTVLVLPSVCNVILNIDDML